MPLGNIGNTLFISCVHNPYRIYKKKMSIGTQILSDKRRTKELKILHLHDQGFSYRKIAKEVHVSLRDVTKYIQTISSKRRSPLTTSVHDEIVLEYTVNLLRSEVKGLKRHS